MKLNIGEIVRVLRKFKINGSPGKAGVSLASADRDVFYKLLHQGYLLETMPVQVHEEEIALARQRMARLQERCQELRKDISEIQAVEEKFRSLAQKEDLARKLQELRDLDREIALARTNLLGLSEVLSENKSAVAFEGKTYALSYKGKELLEEVTPRLARFKEATLEEFNAEIEVLKRIFNLQADKAKEVLKRVSGKLPHIDEVHLRSSAVGVALRAEPADEIAQAYQAAVEGLTTSAVREDRRALVGECIVTNAPALALNEIAFQTSAFVQILERCRLYANNEKDAVNTALLMFPLKLDPADQQSSLEHARALSEEVFQADLEAKTKLAPALVLSRSRVLQDHRKKETVKRLRAQLQDQTASRFDRAFSTTLLVVAGKTLADLEDETTRIQEYLARYTEEPLMLAAIMLALVSTNIEETLDTLRVASAAISKHELSYGGLENLSLGVKLFLQTTVAARKQHADGTALGHLHVLPKEGFIPPSLEIIAFTELPLALPAFFAFHKYTFHKIAIRDSRFHPVHRHYGSYGHYHRSRYRRYYRHYG